MAPEQESQRPHFQKDRRTGHRPHSTDRRKPRMNGPCAAIVHGIDANGQAFRTETLLENLSASGLYFRLQHPVPIGEKLFVVFAFTPQDIREASGPKVATRGTVCRSEAHPDGHCGLAMTMQQWRFV